MKSTVILRIPIKPENGNGDNVERYEVGMKINERTASHERKQFLGFLCMDLDLGGIKCCDEMNDDIETTNKKRE